MPREKRALGSPAMPDEPSGVEKRKDARVPAQGTVRLQPEELFAKQIIARLIDISSRGFRAYHYHDALTRGQMVHFQHASASGQARVVWNRITANSVETGFLIV
jgi:hypothetical protein